MQLRPVRLLALACATAVTMVGMGGAPAHADGLSGGSGNGGFTTSVSATITGGSGDPLTGGGGGSTISISVPPKCWWGTFNNDDVDPTNMKAMEEWFTEMRNGMRGHAAAGYFALPKAEDVTSITNSGTPHTWYELYSAPGVNCAEEGFADSFGTGGDAYGGQGAGEFANVPIEVSYAAFVTGAPTPPPLVDVEDVVETVWDQATAEVDAADLDRNPKLGDVGGASLVNMTTWFWVQNVQEALAEDGEIHLEVSLPGTTPLVQASLDAATEGVQVTSPAGAANCTVEQAKTEYSAGASEAGACTFPFDRANTAGWPVTSAINWTGTWQGTDSGGADGGPLAPISQTSTIQVPVAESQALVNDVD